ncbi:MAG: hypothetical protein ACK4XJ_10070 [Fimbriimonadaceae bacterium]
MDQPFRIFSCALFGLRPERDRHHYYRLLLNDLATKTNLPIIVATNQPEAFDRKINTIHVTSVEAWSEQIWPASSHAMDAIARSYLGWHRKNQRLYQYQNPQVVRAYLAKTALIAYAAKRYGSLLWLDAGFLFSAVYDHTVPTNWVGYSPKKIESRLIPLLTGKEERVLVTTYPRKKRFLRQFRPDFHGMSYRCMNRLARAANATPTDHYTLAPLLYFPKGSAETLLDEFREVWQKMLGLKRLGTEENVLSVLRWRHGWDGMSTEQWLECLYEPSEAA